MLCAAPGGDKKTIRIAVGVFMNEQEFDLELQSFSERILSRAISQEDEASYTESLFDSIRHINEFGQEFWYARELQLALAYKEWRNFKRVIDKAATACEGSDNIVSDHFVDVSKMVNIGSGADRELGDYALSRYACYLINKFCTFLR